MKKKDRARKFDAKANMQPKNSVYTQNDLIHFMVSAVTSAH